MALIPNIIFYVLIFLSVYAQVFFLVTFLENRKKIVIRNEKTKLNKYKTVTIVVPCWNEERTVYKTIRSLLALNYPQDKLKIFLIDDGSTDGTWNIIRKFEKYPNIKIFQKENGGKYTALNLGLEHSETDFFGALDADTVADPESLIRIMSYFAGDKNIMAVVPSVTVYNPKNFIQNIQEVEYHMGVYTKKMLSFLGAINVVPGPLTIFRRKVFDDLGPYQHGHNTEDMEIAYRMQKNNYKIEHCNDAFVYTNTPSTIMELYKQRLRWVYGFINNTIDYRDVLLKKKYGNFSLFTLPTGVISILALSYLFGKVIYDLINFLHLKFITFNTIGWNLSIKNNNFDLFFINTNSYVFLFFLIYLLVIFGIIFGRKMSKGKWVLSFNMIYFLVVFRFLAPFWFLKAMYNTILKRKPAWR